MILLIEDRYKRQQNFIQDTGINLDYYSDILDNYTNDKEIDFFELLKNGNFDFSQYDYIIAHKSAFNSENSEFKSLLENACREYAKPLVYFSGGISVNYYNNNDGEILETNSKTFYSQNLQIFLESYKTKNENILMLCYGKNWEKDIVLNLLEKLNIFLYTTEDKKYLFSDLNDADIDLTYLKKIDYPFYQMKIENDWITKEELSKLKDSCLKYFTTSTTNNNINNSLLISKYNTIDELFDNDIYFDLENEDIDKYITNDIIPQIKDQDCDVVFIKDNLSEHYLELYGLRVAYHIRLSEELKDKKYIPIVIISDLNSEVLNHLEPMANILFTKNIFIVKNDKKDIEDMLKKEFSSLSVDDYQKQFLSKIKIEQPKDYLSHHSIANEWAINRWAETLQVQSVSLATNNAKISSMLYFKYLLAKSNQNNDEIMLDIKLTKKGKVLLIDDEWDKGWSDILSNIFTKNDGIEFETFEHDFKDKSNFNLFIQPKKKIIEFDPDVVILDLRLAQSDHDESTTIDNYSGIKLLKAIHEINAGIQVIMLTATSKSTILEKLYDYNILGYIKKEHPEDFSISTVENINKFVKLVEKGLTNKYLKEIWDIGRKINNILQEDNIKLLLNKYQLKDNRYEKLFYRLKKESQYIFDILNTNNKNKFIYAMLSISSGLETILSIFIDEKNNQFWDKSRCESTTLNTKLRDLINDKFGGNYNNTNMKSLINTRNDYLHMNNPNITVNSDGIKAWFKKYGLIIDYINNPLDLNMQDINDTVGNLQNWANR